MRDNKGLAGIIDLGGMTLWQLALITYWNTDVKVSGDKNPQTIMLMELERRTTWAPSQQDNHSLLKQKQRNYDSEQ